MAAKSDYSIVVKDLYKSYKDVKVLQGVSFNAEKGKILAVLGPNGAGKTTTVKILSTLLQADRGTVEVEGYNVRAEPDKIRSVIGLTGQSAAVDELLTARENLIMMGRLYRLTKKSATNRAVELLEEFDLVEAADRPAKTFSGGMRRRLDLAVSLIATPPVIFLDEPTTGLDPRSRIAMWSSIRSLLDKGTTILLTTQYLEEADQLADQIIVIDGGKVIASGTAKQLKSKVGKDRLELTFKSAKAAKEAQAVLGANASDVSDDHTVSVVINDTNKDVKAMLDSLSKAEIAVDSLAVHKPTLDDVFLSLTGKKKTETGEEK